MLIFDLAEKLSVDEKWTLILIKIIETLTFTKPQF